MTKQITSETRTAQEAALVLGVTGDWMRGFLKRNPDIDARLPRAGGRRMVGPAELEMLRKVIAERRRPRAA